MRSFIIKPGNLIPIGRAGENRATQIRFDVTGWAETYGAGQFELIMQRPGESELPYPIEVTVDGDYVDWTVSNVDTGIAGNCKVQLRYVVSDAVAKSVIYRGIVGESLDHVVDPPDPYDDLIERLEELARQTAQNAEAAAGSATAAGNSATAAAGSATQAAGSATQAGQSATAASQSASDANAAKLASQTAQTAAEAAQAGAEAAEAQATAMVPGVVTSWLDQHVDPETGYVIDDSLTIQGAAADAKAAGDEIRDIKSYIVEEEPVTLNDITVPPTILKGKYKVTLDSGSTLYNGTVNVAALLGLKQGSFDVRGCTVTITGNKVKLSGTVSTGSPNVSLTRGEIATTTELANADMPLPTHRFTLSQKVTSGTGAPALCIRSKTSGNVATTQNNTAQFDFSTSTCGDLYLPMSAKAYDCEFVVALFPYNTTNGNNYREQDSSVTTIATSGTYSLDGSTWNAGNVSVSEIKSKFPKKPLLKYSTRSLAYSNMQECLDVYIPAKKGYVNYIFGRTQSPSAQSEGGGNVWRLVQVDAVGEALDYRFHITQQGETEMAIQIAGRDDFIGGTTHGDEWMDSASLLFVLDGEPIDVTTLTDVTEFETLQVFLVSNLYDPADHSTLVGVHGREWIFNAQGLYIGQTVEFKTDVTLGNTYMPMFPVMRGNDTVSTLQVTDTYADDGNYQIYDVSTGGFTNYPNMLKADVRDMYLTGEESKVSARLTILEQPEGLKGEGVFLYNGVNTYNKIYCAICGYGNTAATQESIASGTKWKVKSQFTIEIG